MTTTTSLTIEGPAPSARCSDPVPAPRLPTLAMTWVDPVTRTRAYLVIDRLVRGVASGGLRMRAGVTLDEVAGLAAGMSLKEALHFEPASKYVPLGGAKGGIDIDPRDPRSTGVLERFLRAIGPIVSRNWAMGEDLGLTQSRLDSATAAAGLSNPVEAIFPLLPDLAESQARLERALHLDVDGIQLDASVGGYGVAEATIALLEHDGKPLSETRVVIQGVGTMGGATARFLSRAGAIIVGMADAKGLIANQDGLDVETLLSARDAFGTIDRGVLRGGDLDRPGSDWLGLDADVLIPAAVSYAINADNQAAITAKYIVEAANMPVLPEAEVALLARGVQIIPDVLANSGTNAWWWWVTFGDVDGGPEQSFAKVSSSIRRLVAEAIADPAPSLREATLAIADRQLGLIELHYPSEH
jgi:glutamate dehydrogenase (NAD(P)+)